ncbi:hypothetical protein [Luteibaculum oceani]|uniref:Uncharacterized protein n=1 Tax=Luteibaculum oceani TaxID=1294296 RepID=A0A5C6V2F9_9FLAO|nr:hypothetical protein [Luteibaculum oceani]TXC78666.1 hypothetical protein FRX97_08080 [Luteibaculum oceani]
MDSTLGTKTAIKSVSQHLVNRISEDGSLTFKVFADSTLPTPDHQNILWHAATVEALSRHGNHPIITSHKQELIKAANHLKGEGISKANICSDCLGVWIDSYSLSHEKNIRKVKLGAVGIALAALVEMETTQPNFTSKVTLNGLANFIKSMEIDSGGLAAQYIPTQTDSIAGIAPLRFAGMAAFALIKYYEYTQEKSWLDFAYRILNHYAHDNIKNQSSNIDNWITMAYRKFIQTYPSAPGINNYDLEYIKAHTQKMVEMTLEKQILEDSNSTFYGSYDLQGLTFKTAAKGLTLAYAYWILENNTQLKAKIINSLYASSSFIIRAQIKEGKYKGGIPRAIMRIPSASSFFNLKQSEIRLDYLILSLDFLHECQNIFKSSEV